MTKVFFFFKLAFLALLKFYNAIFFLVIIFSNFFFLFLIAIIYSFSHYFLPISATYQLHVLFKNFIMLVTRIPIYYRNKKAENHKKYNDSFAYPCPMPRLLFFISSQFETPNTLLSSLWKLMSVFKIMRSNKKITT